MKFLLFFFLLFSTDYIYTQDLSLKEQKIQEELQNDVPTPKGATDINSMDVPSELNIDSVQAVVEMQRTLPNDGNAYFTISGGLAPYQVGLGMLKYFIPEWWGHIELNVAFFPNRPVSNYYSAESYEPFVAFKIISGYSFYSRRNFEISVFGQINFAFISTTDIPIVSSLGFRFIYDFIWIDIGASYAATASGVNSEVFQGFHPAISLGFRF